MKRQKIVEYCFTNKEKLCNSLVSSCRSFTEDTEALTVDQSLKLLTSLLGISQSDAAMRREMIRWNEGKLVGMLAAFTADLRWFFNEEVASGARLAKVSLSYFNEFVTLESPTQYFLARVTFSSVRRRGSRQQCTPRRPRWQ